MAMTILVTGATGTIGSQVLRHLAERDGVTVRAAVRSPDEHTALAGARVAPVSFDYAKPELLKAALDGVSRAFLLTPFVREPAELAQPFIETARAAGVQHIVKLSAFGCEVEPGIALGRAHRAMERTLESSGVAWTFLRPNNFMQNFIHFYAPDTNGAIYLPWGDGACSFVDAYDVAAVAAAALVEEGHVGKAYALTGPEAISIGEAASALGEATGRGVHYVDVPEPAARRAMLDRGTPSWMVDAMMELFAVDKAGYAATVTPTIQEITGRPSRTFREFARENASRWAP